MNGELIVNVNEKKKSEDTSILNRLNDLEMKYCNLKNRLELIMEKLENVVEENNNLKNLLVSKRNIYSDESSRSIHLSDWDSESLEPDSEDRKFIAPFDINDIMFSESDVTYKPDNEQEGSSFSSYSSQVSSNKPISENDDVEMLSKSISNIKVDLD